MFRLVVQKDHTAALKQHQIYSVIFQTNLCVISVSLFLHSFPHSQGNEWPVVVYKCDYSGGLRSVDEGRAPGADSDSQT